MGVISYLKGLFRKMLNYQTISQAEQITTPISPEMVNALQAWNDLYTDNPDWKKPGKVKTQNLPAQICEDMARQITLEMQATITGKDANGDTSTEDGEAIENDRSLYLEAEFEKLLAGLRLKLEQGCAAGGMIIKPYVSDGHIYFDYTMDWDLYPLAFDNAGNLSDVIIPDWYTDGKNFYTRLERHQLQGKDVLITNTCYKSSQKDILGKPVPLTAVDRWKDIQPAAKVQNAEGQLFGWFKVAAANAVDLNCPLGSSVFAKAIDVIREADLQYSRILWEYEGSELAIDVDPTALKRKPDGSIQMPQLNDRLFRAVDIEQHNGEMYQVFSPTIRDQSLLNGLNVLLQRVEDLCGLSRGTLSDANQEAKTATELKIVKQRSYATVSDNQQALERCLKDVVRAMDKYCTAHGLAPEGGYDVSFEWDDSIIVDTETQMQQLLSLCNQGIVSKVQFRMSYFGETEAQAKAALDQINAEREAELDDAFKIRDE